MSIEYLQIILTLYLPNFATNGRLAEDCLGSFLYGAFQNDRIVLGRLSILYQLQRVYAPYGEVRHGTYQFYTRYEVEHRRSRED